MTCRNEYYDLTYFEIGRIIEPECICLLTYYLIFSPIVAPLLLVILIGNKPTLVENESKLKLIKI